MVGEHDAEPGGHGKNSDRQKGDERTGPPDLAPGIVTNADIHHPVGAATWSKAGQLDWWVKERREWWGRVRGTDGR
jgi:hypothetical protein